MSTLFLSALRQLIFGLGGTGSARVPCPIAGGALAKPVKLEFSQQDKRPSFSSIWLRMHRLRRSSRRLLNRRISNKECPIAEWKHLLCRRPRRQCLLFLLRSAAACSTFCGFLSDS